MDVQDFLKQKKVKFELIAHQQAFTAQEVAATEHVTGHKFAKTVILVAGEEACMVVLPASRHVDLGKAGRIVGKEVELASEGKMKQLFPDCEIGAEPPFGSQYGLKTYVDKHLEGLDEIVFRAGTHDRTVKMKYADYAKLEKPKAGDFAVEDF